MTDNLTKLPRSHVPFRLQQLETVVNELLERVAALEAKPAPKDPFQLYAGDLPDDEIDRMNEPRDFDYLPENVNMHTMMRFYQHDDGRGCGYHSRLGKWTFGDVYECLRTHTDQGRNW